MPDDASGQAFIAHQPVDGAGRHPMPLKAQISRHLVLFVHARRRPERRTQRLGQMSISHRCDTAMP